MANSLEQYNGISDVGGSTAFDSSGKVINMPNDLDFYMPNSGVILARKAIILNGEEVLRIFVPGNLKLDLVKFIGHLDLKKPAQKLDFTDYPLVTPNNLILEASENTATKVDTGIRESSGPIAIIDNGQGLEAVIKFQQYSNGNDVMYGAWRWPH